MIPNVSHELLCHLVSYTSLSTKLCTLPFVNGQLADVVHDSLTWSRVRTIAIDPAETAALIPRRGEMKQVSVKSSVSKQKLSKSENWVHATS